MKPATLFLLTLSACILFFGCSRKGHQSLSGTSQEEIKAIIDKPLAVRNNYFAFDIMREIYSSKENIIFSPISISTALAMTYAGAIGKTAKEMSNTLYFDPDQASFHSEFGDYIKRLKQMTGEKLQINLANSLWAHKGYYFLPEYFKTIEDNYGSVLFQVDYKGDREVIRQDINYWVGEQTRDKIQNLISQGVLTEDTRLVLINAIHFLGNWMAEFNKENTRQQAFYVEKGKQEMTDFMQHKSYYRYFEDSGMQVLEKPYSGGNFSMVILLPAENIDPKTIIHNMDGLQFEHMLTNLQRTHIDLRMPKFEFEYGINLEDMLAKMGMPLAFSLKADFSGMTGHDSLMIDKVIHKAMIDVSETGTEAAAATAIVMITKTSIEPEPERTILFNANRPFVYLIKDNTNNGILFMGVMAHP